MTRRSHRLAALDWLLRGGAAALVLLWGVTSRAQPGDPEADPEIPSLTPFQDDAQLAGQPILQIHVEPEAPDPWFRPASVVRVRPGQYFSPAAARVAMQELADSGAYSGVRAEIRSVPGGVHLHLVVIPRRLLSGVRIVGGVFSDEETLRVAKLELPSDLTRTRLANIEAQVVSFYANRGYPAAQVRALPKPTDDPQTVLLELFITPLEPQRIEVRQFEVSPRTTPDLSAALADYPVVVGTVADEVTLDAADRQLRLRLAQLGWHDAKVNHGLDSQGVATRLVVRVAAGPRYRVRFEGLQSFDQDQLLTFIDLPQLDDRSTSGLERRIRQYYVARGFFDVRIGVERREALASGQVDLVFHVREGQRLRVVAREFPCLAGTRTPDQVGAEIDAFLSESLPGASLLTVPPPRTLNTTLSPAKRLETGPQPLELNPWGSYEPEVYARALEHLEKLYKSEGYLAAQVGPVVLLRRACDPRYPGRCQPLGERQHLFTACPEPGVLPEANAPAAQTLTCQKSTSPSTRCEQEVVLHIPVKPGPRTYLWDLSFEGNRTLPAKALAEATELQLEQPVAQLTLERARQNVLEAYAEEGFAFVSAEVELEFSQDHTRAHVRFVITERERVQVSDVVVRGARRTRESLILGRVALQRGNYYKRSLVRQTEERLATLGVFASIAVELQDPEVPARDKVVVIRVQERPSQRVDTLAGFSTGEGVRLGFEYGHRNIAQRAIEFTLGLQVAYLPSVLILDPGVRDNFDALQARSGLISRIERRLSASVGLPEIGLGPLYRLSVEGVDVRDLARDFALTRDAAIVTLIYRPTLRFSTKLGTSFEVNDAEILTPNQGLDEYLQANPDNPALRRLLNVPEGRTFVIAQNTGFTWDRRDNPLAATSGSFVSFNAEHVNGFPAEDNPRDLTSHFMRYTGRVAGYLRLSPNGLALAASLGAGGNQQLSPNSQTYPDRLFFLGGIDTLRGFLQDSVIPQDLAERILRPEDPDNPLTVNEVTIRGGDLSVNPRLELRVPITGVFQTAAFLDAGNLWFDANNFDPLVLRYAAGSGLRIATPLGPLVLDYGINLKRRPWEDLTAFHLTLGLF